MESKVSTHSEFLIVGAGIFGTSTAYHLSKNSKNPASITIVDRAPSPSHYAASTDINKIIREDYTVRFYMDLASEAIQAWNSWPELKGKGYYHRTGWVNINESGIDITSRILANYRERGRDPSEILSIEELRSGDRFGGLFRDADLNGFDSAYWNPEAGWCDAGAATAELCRSAVERGVKYVTGSASRLVLTPGGHGVTGVELEDGVVLTADKILLATGAWTSSLLSPIEDELAIDEADRIERQIVASGVCVAHYALSQEEATHLDKTMPVVIYGTHGDLQPPPAMGCGPRLLKFTNSLAVTNPVTTKTGHIVSVPPSRPQEEVSVKFKEETCRLLPHRLLPGLTRDREVHSWRLCWDAISPSQDQLITKHPDTRLGNLYIAAGGSFHSYKFLPTIGRYIVNVLHDRGNGEEKDARWAWKDTGRQGRGAHEKAYPTRPLRDMED